MGKILVGVVAVAIGFGGCGDDDGDDPSASSGATGPQDNAKRAQTRECITPSRAAVRALEESLTGGGTLRAARALPSADSYKGPAELHEDAVFIAAKLGADKSLIWLSTKEFVDTGEGLAIAASTGTRRVSSFGADQDPALIGISAQSRGLAEVRECVNERIQQSKTKARTVRSQRAAQRARAQRATARRARRAAQRAARRQRQADRAAQAAPEPDAAPDAPSVPGGTCADTPQTDFPVPPGDSRDRDGDGIACES